MMLQAANLGLGARLRDVSVALRPGTVTAICGPNGAGKSTLLSCLAGLLPPDDGAVLLDGAPLASLTAQERQSLVRACVEKIVLRNDKIEIFYTIDSAESSASQAG